MDEETKNIAKDILAVIARARDYTNVAPHEVFMDAEALVSSLAFLVGPKLAAEGRYREKVRKYMEDDFSAARAEIYAKADPEYIEWKKLEHVYDLAQDQIMLLKKFREDLTAEYQRS